MDQLQHEQVGLREAVQRELNTRSYVTLQLSPRREDLRTITHTAAGGDSDLDGVSPGLANVLQVQRLVGCFVVPSLDGEGRGVDADLDGGGPVCVHLPVLVVVALKLQLQVRPVGATAGGKKLKRGKTMARRLRGRDEPPHERLVDGGS